MATYGTTDEILRAYGSLSDDQLLGLRAAARRYLGGTRFSEPLDLAHEALYLALEGRRNWPTHIDFALFLAMTMRSVADADRKRHENSLAVRTSIEELLETVPDWVGSHPSVEDEFLAQEQNHIAQVAADIARAGLAGDESALKVLNGMVSGMSPKEMREAFGLNAKAFDAARHRALRKVRNAAQMQ